jgi:hypothetical protein
VRRRHLRVDQRLGLIQEFCEPLIVVAKNKPLQKRFSRRCSKKGVVPILRDIDPYDQILLRMPDLFFQLTKLLQPVTIQFM